MAIPITVGDIALARYRLSRYLQPTPLESAPALGSGVWLKLENINKTHSFKVRGALNALLCNIQRGQETGVVAASSGNHAQGIAYAAHLLNVRARIFMPLHTPHRKVEGVRRYGAEAVLFGDTYDEAETQALHTVHDEGVLYISPYNNLQVIFGAGTIALEIFDELPEVERVIVPVSGGGLISGIGLAMKNLKPSVEVIGICAQSAPAMYNHFYMSDHPQVWDTLAEALSGEIEKGSVTFGLAERNVNRIGLVPEEAIARAMRWMLAEHGWIVEGGGAVGIAALQTGIIELDERPTVIVVSGGNVDIQTLRNILN